MRKLGNSYKILKACKCFITQISNNDFKSGMIKVAVLA